MTADATSETLVDRPAADETGSRRDVAYDRIRRWILEGRLVAGTRIDERGLAGELGVSTTPVKEAIRRLELEGLVVSVPRRGTMISFQPHMVGEMMLIRAALEGTAARIAAGKAEAADHARIDALTAEMTARTEAGDLGAVAEANTRFHDAINAIAGNAWLATLIGGLEIYDTITRTQALASVEEARRALAEHRAVADAIRAGDGNAAEAAMRAHVVRSATTLIERQSGGRI